MDAGVKGDVGEVVVHGGGCWGRATVAAATTTVTLRCAGRNRRTVTGRELPRTSVASRDRIDESRVLRKVAAVARPQQVEGRSGGGLQDEGLVGDGGPEKPGELAGDGDGRDGGALAVFGEMVVAAVQPGLRLPGASIGLRTAVGSAGPVPVGPGGLDQQPAGVMVAGLGDVPAVALLAGGVLGGDDPQPGAQFPWVSEASEVADLGNQPERGASRDPAKPRQDLDRGCPALAARDLLEVAVQLVELAIQPVEVDQHLLERCLGELVVESLTSDPRPVHLRPLALAVSVDPAMPQQLL